MGVDVFHGDGDIDWKKVKEAGNSFAIVKASEGASEVDPKLPQNLAGLTDAGMVRGVYHFYHYLADAQQQAQHFINTVKDAGYDFAKDLPVCVDVERGAGFTGAPNLVEVQTGFAIFLHTLTEATGKKAIIYGSKDYLEQWVGNYPASVGYGLWIADWGVSNPSLPLAWTRWEFWQTGDNGIIDGMPNPADVDRYHGTEAQLRAWASC